MSDEYFVLEALPESIIAALEVRDRWFNSLPRPTDGGPEFVAADLQSWRRGQSIRVAFLGGDTALHRDIEEATKQISDACNLQFDFGFDESSGEYRRWSESDTEYAAEIRVSFDRNGYWSLVGTDSIDRNIVDPLMGIGGAPNTRSLNLGGFDIQRPASWQGTARHEFMHAVAFHHEHQNFRGPCQNEFRWEDDEGYVPTQNADGVFVADSAGRRPGIYTFLAGPPNRWSRSKVDHNLKTTNDPDTVMGSFDDASVMLYRFPTLFYKSNPSDCAPSGEGQDLSGLDKRGLVLLYGENPVTIPAEPERIAAADDEDSVGHLIRMQSLLDTIAPSETAGLESLEVPSEHQLQATRLIKEYLFPER
ncbi:MAG: hypothetical protein DBP02_17775 [gamma proteobacterium symbiont of Ctena orbiculata]|nr:MAG: hypothetical protein DBP02_17775 [gamma proteobacterium symbiont of Ctena orbiculata]